uniref:Hypothetical chloroplast RF55 n=1 Tax=Gastroclonium compressum TaxID=1852973 RepID=A0A173FZU3_GASCM|nr:hypothetical chloroplast RF55 [Coeloseira compressa]ANH09537.1 hypothetical chloroplast RF55 [Coeloseira compressa]
MLLTYWPKYKSFLLNNEVAYLFAETRFKFSSLISKKSNIFLYIDILDDSIKQKLFTIVLNQLEILLLDIVELDLRVKHIELLNYKILYDLIHKIFIQFLKILNVYSSSCNFSLSINGPLVSQIKSEHNLLLENLLIYLIFGSSQIKKNIYAFDSDRTPHQHVLILLENFVIQTSNLVLGILFDSINSLNDLTKFLTVNRICNLLYLSTRSVASLTNNLMWQAAVYKYIQQPKDIYSNRYRVWLVNNKNLQSQYIYACRFISMQHLHIIQYIFLFFLELQDVFIPKIERSFWIFLKVSAYIFISLIGNSIIFCVRSIASILYSK